MKLKFSKAVNLKPCLISFQYHPSNEIAFNAFSSIISSILTMTCLLRIESILPFSIFSELVEAPAKLPYLSFISQQISLTKDSRFFSFFTYDNGMFSFIYANACSRKIPLRYDSSSKCDEWARMKVWKHGFVCRKLKLFCFFLKKKSALNRKRRNIENEAALMKIFHFISCQKFTTKKVSRQTS